MSTDGLTEKKLEVLSNLYQDIVPASPETESFYLEILVSCDGDVKAAAELINDSLGVQRSSKPDTSRTKRKHEDEVVNPAPKVQKV